MTTWLDFRSEPMAERPEIEILYVGKNENDEYVYAASCPAEKCEWAEVIPSHSDIEDLVFAHEDWHENGMPE